MKSILSKSPDSTLLTSIFRDLVVIVAGVLIALWAEGEWQARQDKQIVWDALAQIARDLKKDISDISGNLERAQVGLEAAKWIDSNRDAALGDTQELRDAFFNVGHCSALNLDPSAYVALKSSGNLRLIEDKELLHRITSVYEVRGYLAVIHLEDCASTDEVLRLLMPHVRHSIPPETRPGGTENWDMWDQPIIVEIVDPQEMLRDRVLLNRIMALTADRQLLVAMVEDSLRESQGLRDQILERIVD